MSPEPSYQPSSTVAAIHTAVAGRARLRVPGLRRGEALKEALEAELTAEEGIRSVSASVLTGNVLVLFGPGMDLDRLTELLETVARRVEPAAVPEPPRSRRNGGSLLPRMRRSLPRPRKSRNRESPVSGAEQPRQTWHLQSAEDTASFWETSLSQGLSAAEASQRLARYGANQLTAAEPRSAARIFLDQMNSLPVILLLASAVLSIATGGAGDAVVILGVVILNAGVGTWTEHRSERTITALTSVEPPAASVVREGESRQVPAAEVVVGDVVLLSRGSWVPADARLVEVDRLTVDESALTGESLPVQKIAGSLDRPDLPLGDRVNMVYRGTVVTGGSGRAVVVATGGTTEVGLIQKLVTEASQPETPIQRRLGELGRQLVVATAAISGAVFLVGWLRGFGRLEILKTAISLAVAAVPEGLPTVATTTLAWGVRRLGQQGVLVRRLDAVEALGAVQVLCLDKTGTITTNRMRAVAAFAGGRRLAVEDGRFLEDGRTVAAGESPELLRLLDAVVLCNEAQLTAEEPRIVGSSTETALLQMAMAAGLDVAALRERHPLVRTEQRAEGRMYMSTFHAARPGRLLVVVKGRPDEILSLSRRCLADGETRELTADDRAAVEAENERMAGEALRVLGVALREAPEEEAAAADLTWLGLVGLADPPRPGIAGLIRRLHGAGIRTLMITGDQSATAHAVGRSLDLARGGSLETLDSTRLERIPPEVLTSLLRRTHLFSRVDPSHKLQIVRALQRDGLVVAMTGDGINDGPALKAADIGVAMGKDGAELARQVADVLLVEDDVHALVPAIAQGRAIYDDIGKSIHFIVATNLSETLFMLSSAALGLGLPLGPKQLLWINLLTDVFPELALAVEPPESDVLARPPRDPAVPLVSPADFRRIGVESTLITGAALGGYLYGRRRYGAGPKAGTVAFMTITGAQLLHAISSRSESHSVFDLGRLPPNRYISMAVGGGFAVQVLAAGLASVRHLLGTSRISIGDGLVSGGCAILSFAANEALKVLRRSRTRGPRDGRAGLGRGSERNPT